MEEKWKEIPGFEGKYCASTLGRIKSLDRVDSRGQKRIGIVLKQELTPKGYNRVTLYSDVNGERNWKVHQLVMLVFGVLKRGDVIDHINHNRSDNRIENLRSVTQRFNCGHRKLKSKSHLTGVTFNKVSGKWHSHIRVKNRRIGLISSHSEFLCGAMYNLAVKNLKLYDGDILGWRLELARIGGITLPVSGMMRQRLAEMGYDYFEDWLSGRL